MNANRYRRRGLTLLELIVAIGMAAALSLCLYAALSITFRARQTVREQTRGPREATIALDVLRQDFESVLPPGEAMVGPFIGTASGSAIDSADHVEFFNIGTDPGQTSDVDPYAEAPLTEGVQWVELSLRTETDPPTLVRRVDRNLTAPSPIEPPEEVLLTGVRSLTLRYFDGYVWLEDWDSTLLNDALPLAVEITLELDTPAPDGDATYRVSQVVPLACGNLAALSESDESLEIGE